MEPMSSLVAVATVSACSDCFDPPTENVAGDYRLQSLVTMNGGDWTDWRAAGATFTISLAPNGTTSGHLFIPGSNGRGSDFSVDMAGTWALNDETVTFMQAADSFVPYMAFDVGENRLSGDLTSGHGRVIAVLKK